MPQRQWLELFLGIRKTKQIFVNFDVLAVNDAPVAVDDTFDAFQNTELVILSSDYLSNDYDVDGDTLLIFDMDSFSISGGEIFLDRDNNIYYYSPSDFSGTDSFTYTISDGNGGTDTATVFVNVAAVNNAVVAGSIWWDSYANVIQDSTEQGLAGIRIDLYLDNGDGVFDTTLDTHITERLTDASGYYDFQNLKGGNYFLDVSDSDVQTVLPGGELTSGTDPRFLSLASHEQALDVNFGYAPPAPGTSEVSGFIWDDFYTDGIKDTTERGLSGITVELYLDNDDGVFDTASDSHLMSIDTDIHGFYIFEYLNDGNYILNVVDEDVQLALPGGELTSGPQSNTDPLFLSLASDEQVSDVNFGYAFAAVGGLVWNDVNADGIKDEIESGLAGIGVELYTDDGDIIGVLDANDTFTDFRVTDQLGMYDFLPLPTSGNYILNVVDGMQDPLAITLAIGEQFFDADIGYFI